MYIDKDKAPLDSRFGKFIGELLQTNNDIVRAGAHLSLEQVTGAAETRVKTTHAKRERNRCIQEDSSSEKCVLERTGNSRTYTQMQRPRTSAGKKAQLCGEITCACVSNACVCGQKQCTCPKCKCGRRGGIISLAAGVNNSQHPVHPCRTVGLFSNRQLKTHTPTCKFCVHQLLLNRGDPNVPVAPS